MRASQELYGSDFDATLLKDMTVENYLWKKIHASQELVDRLQSVPFMERDLFRINKSLESQKHNRALLDELYGRDNK